MERVGSRWLRRALLHWVPAIRVGPRRKAFHRYMVPEGLNLPVGDLDIAVTQPSMPLDLVSTTCAPSQSLHLPSLHLPSLHLLSLHLRVTEARLTPPPRRGLYSLSEALGVSEAPAPIECFLQLEVLRLR
jgi:hypothetical protein